MQTNKHQIILDRKGDLALYRQIAAQFKRQINNGTLPAGVRLPTIRQLARDLETTRLTVQKAYDLLHDEGLTETIVGRGTFVCQSARPQHIPTILNQQFNPQDVLREVQQSIQIKQVHSMGVATGDSALFPQDAWQACIMEAQSDIENLLHYGDIVGDPQLRIAIHDLVSADGLSISVDQILITNGVMQGLNLVARALTQPGDIVLVEQPTFLGILNLLRSYGLHPLPIPLDKDGPDLDYLAQVLKQQGMQWQRTNPQAVYPQRPLLYYTVPSFQNPTGCCFSRERRLDLLALAAQHNVLLVEDDIYRNLNYTNTAVLPLAALADVKRGEAVIHISSFSKVLMPGLRIGYLTAPHPILERLIVMRHLMDLSGTPLMQRALAHFLQQGAFKPHLKRIMPVYDKRRQALLDALRTFMPKAVVWTQPQGGFCCWVSMPRCFGVGELSRLALRNGITIAAGEAFLTQGPFVAKQEPVAIDTVAIDSEPATTKPYTALEQEHFRICFGNESAEGIRAAVAQLAIFIRERLDEGDSASALPQQRPFI
ncbi:MAG: PLP-dependent aminotransferase family protein [Chloroflexota bacterium]